MPDDAPQYANEAEALKAQKQDAYLQSQGIVNDKGAFLDTNTGTYVSNPTWAALQQEQQAHGGATGLVDQAIESRRLFERHRQGLYDRLHQSSSNEAPAIMNELHGMEQSEQQRQFEANRRRMTAHQAMEASLQQAKLDRETDIDEHGSALVEALPRLRGMLRNGQISKEDYDSSVLDVVGKYGALGMHHPGAAQLVNHYIEEADKQNAFQQRRSTSEATKLAGKYGIEPQVDPQTGLPSVEHTRAAALQTPKGRVEMLTSLNQEMKQKYGLGTGVSSLFNPVQPHSSPDKGKTIDIPFLEPKTGKIGKANIPTPLFEQMKADFGDRYFATVPQQQAPAAQQADPRTELAQRALNDPNASEAHKSAARRILGIQDNAQ